MIRKKTLIALTAGLMLSAWGGATSAALIDDHFDGGLGDPTDGSVWDILAGSSATQQGDSTVLLDGDMKSDATYVQPGKLLVRLNSDNVVDGTTFIGFYDGASEFVVVRLNSGSIDNSLGAGVAALTMPSSGFYDLTIDWTSAGFEISVDDGTTVDTRSLATTTSTPMHVWINASAVGPDVGDSTILIDQVVLPVPIPEPATLGLIGFGALLILCRSKG